MLVIRSHILVAATLFVAALLVACGGDDDAGPTATPASSGSTGAGSTGGSSGSSTGATSGAINSYEDVQAAVIQIIAQGTFRDPEVGLANGSGAGSGFIISADGLAVTNNHVVSGAATLEVFIGGDTSKSYNATILGVSECNDLALIDIRESEPLSFLEWFEEEIAAGTDVYAAGFPLGDPQFTLTRGIVSKEKADGDITGTSSIDYTIEHDANIQPGNSGGPLVSADGKVLGINYAGGAEATTTAQFFAIASHLAKPVVEELLDGDFEALGINGWAVYDEALGISGIWVAGLSAGSPAAQAGLLPGDILTLMNGLPMGSDGTMADYCDVIRTAGTDRPMTIEVLRYDTGEILRGEINGDTPIDLVFSPAADVRDEASDDITGGAQSYSGYTSITDDTSTIVVEVPSEWTDLDTEPFELSGQVIPYIAAAPDLDDFIDTYDTSGMVFALFPPAPEDSLEATVDRFGPDEGDCEDLGYFEYSDPIFAGTYHAWQNCGAAGATFVVLAAVPEDGSYTAVMLVQMTVEADYEALDQLFATFNVLQ